MTNYTFHASECNNKLDFDKLFSIKHSKDNNKDELILNALADFKISSLYIDIHLDSEIQKIRSSDYRWLNYNSNLNLIANYFSPKIICLKNKKKIVGLTSIGAWEILPSNIKKIRWWIVHPELQPTIFFDDNHIRRSYSNQNICKNKSYKIGLLYGTGPVEEFSRTPIGFKPLICFTDHADFDNTENLKIQREFFNKLNIKITKSFFLYNSSSPAKATTFEDQIAQSEFKKWELEGHELCYHSMSDICLPNWSSQFNNFCSPKGINKVKIYIDHSTHPYNYTKTTNLPNWYEAINLKGIKLIWNYLDSGPGNYYAINQINPYSFTAHNIIKSYLHSKVTRLNTSLKSVVRDLLLYFANDELSSLSLKIKVYPMKSLNEWTLRYFPGFLKAIILICFKYLINPLFYINLVKNYKKPFKHSKFGATIFDAINQNGTKVKVMQTIALRDFRIAFSEKSLTQFIEEKGVLIGHTYFSVFRPSHEGSLFGTKDYQINTQVSNSFERLSKYIKEQKIWNPTASELSIYFSQLEELEYKFDPNGNITLIKKDFQNVISREI